MAAIEKIAIEVSSEVAEAYRSATATERLQIATRIGLMLRSATGSRQEAIDRLKQTMDEIGNEAAEAGLTPEILESILNAP
jgi:chorismate mutase